MSLPKSSNRRRRDIRARLDGVPSGPWYVHEYYRRGDTVLYALASVPDNETIMLFERSKLDYRFVEFLTHAREDIEYLMGDAPRRWWQWR